MSLQKIPRNLAIVYTLLGILWVSFSNVFLLKVSNQDAALLSSLTTYKGWLFVLFSGFTLYISARYFIQRVEQTEDSRLMTYQELEAAYEELMATEEELHEQYNELQKYADKTERQRFEFESLFHNMLDGFILFDITWNKQGFPADYVFTVVNPAFFKQTGLAPGKFIGQSIFNVFPMLERAWLNAFQRVAITGKPCTITHYSQDIKRYLTLTAYQPEPGKMAVQFIDVTAEKQHLAKIEHMAYHDALTDLPNRENFQQKLQKALNKADNAKHLLALFFLDLDRFKLVNDTLGHDVGDQLLMDVAACLRSCLEPNEAVARVGGDEFTILLPVITSQLEAQKRAEKILHTLNTWPFQSKINQVTANMGIAIYPKDGTDGETLLKKADMAMYHVKKQGRNRYSFYTKKMSLELRNQLIMEDQLQKALKNQEFRLYYQPLVNPAGHVVGTEALIRWQPPTGDLIPPDQFIPLAEETGLIVDIGRWVLEEACRQNKAWQNIGYKPLSVSVNLSACQFQQPDLPDQVADALRISGLAPEFLNLEITETVAMQDADFTIETLHALRNQGATLALDDFGTGYSSFVYLKRFPIQTLKIDRSFVSDILSDPDDAAIVKVILDLARNLQIKVVAEGVETKGQAHFLSTNGCDLLQGYYFGKPMLPSKLAQLLALNK